MTTRPDPRRVRRLLAGYCLEVEPGQKVLVRSTTLAAPLLLELQRAILERDAWPVLELELPGETAGFYEHARDIHLDDVDDVRSPAPRGSMRCSAIQAPDARELAAVDPALIARAARARRRCAR